MEDDEERREQRDKEWEKSACIMIKANTVRIRKNDCFFLCWVHSYLLPKFSFAKMRPKDSEFGANIIAEANERDVAKCFANRK